MKYFLSDFDHAYAMDKKGNDFIVTKKGLITTDKGTVDCMRGGVTEEEAKFYVW